MVVVGAGPYGLAAASHLSAAGVEVRTFGRPMEFWERNMPRGMLLRSAWEASHIADAEGRFSLDAYENATGKRLRRPIPLADFVDYGRWYQRQAVPEPDGRRVEHIEHRRGRFELGLSDESLLEAGRVVVATGLERFAWRPRLYRNLPSELVSHTAEHVDLGRFRGLRVGVLGAGQSAVESAALLAEGGASVELFARAPTIRWLRRPRTRDLPSRVAELLYPPTDVGPPVLNWIVALPELYRSMPAGLQDRIAYRCIRPAAAAWLRERIDGARLTTACSVSSVVPSSDGLEVRIGDGDVRRMDHLLLATGYRVDVDRVTFLSDSMRAELATRRGSPLLSRDLESSIPGLYFVGAAAAESVGPIMRFVVGTTYAGRSVCGHFLQSHRRGVVHTLRAYAPRRDRVRAAASSP